MPDNKSWEAGTWEGAEALRRKSALAMSPTQRMEFVEELIEMAIFAGTFRNKLGEAFPKEKLLALR